MASRVVERECRHAFFDDGGSPAILHLVEQRPALAFSLEQGASDGRPAQNRGISEVEDIMEAVAVGIVGVVSELCPEGLAVDQDAHALTHLALDIDKLDFEPAW